ncbi:MAG: PQQ-binding-like beta-propeller repeat protein [Acidimicrobiales bacterium]
MRAPTDAGQGGVRHLVAGIIVGSLLATGAVTVTTGNALAATGGQVVVKPTLWDWPSFGQNAQHTFSARTTLTKSSVADLAQRWFFPTQTAVTVTPTVVDGTVYAGSWDQWFYAINLYTGKLEWKFHTFAQPAVTPYPGEVPRDVSSDGGMITSSAWYQPGNGRRPDLVIFGGGYTLYALNAHTGKLYWYHRYTGRPTKPPNPKVDGARIFSSPVVFETRVLFGISVDGKQHERGYIVAASLATGNPAWIYQSDRKTNGTIPNDGCGNVWSSGSILPRQGWVVFGEADCNFADPPPNADSVMALRISNGTLVWRYRPYHAPNLRCDLDFGASINIGLTKGTRATFLGASSKDGTYYSLNPTNGHLRWKTQLVFGGYDGGYIGTPAYNGTTVFGATALGTFGRTTTGATLCDPSTPRDTKYQQPSIAALNARNGSVRWHGNSASSFAATTYAGGMVFNSRALNGQVVVRNAATGTVLTSLNLPNWCWSGISVVGNAVLFGIGSGPQGSPGGIEVFTPGGQPPSVPGEKLSG